MTLTTNTRLQHWLPPVSRAVGAAGFALAAAGTLAPAVSAYVQPYCNVPSMLLVLALPVGLGGANALRQKFFGKPFLSQSVTNIFSAFNATSSYLAIAAGGVRAIFGGAVAYGVLSCAIGIPMVLGAVALGIHLATVLQRNIPANDYYRGIDLQAAPTLGAVLRAQPDHPIAYALKNLTHRLLEEPERRLLTFLRLDPDGLDLAALVGEVRVVERLPAGTSKLITGAAYDFANRVLFSPDNGHTGLQHELLHAVHTAALSLHITAEELVSIRGWWSDQPESYYDDETRAALAVINAWGGAAAELAPDIKQAGAQLLMQKVYCTDAARFEAIGTAFDVLNDPKCRFAYFTARFCGRSLLPILWTSGIPRQGTFGAMPGYGNRRLRETMYRQGLFGSLSSC